MLVMKNQGVESFYRSTIYCGTFHFAFFLSFCHFCFNYFPPSFSSIHFCFCLYIPLLTSAYLLFLFLSVKFVIFPFVFFYIPIVPFFCSLLFLVLFCVLFFFILSNLFILFWFTAGCQSTRIIARIKKHVHIYIPLTLQ